MTGEQQPQQRRTLPQHFTVTVYRSVFHTSPLPQQRQNMTEPSTNRSVFVTVGTTKFDALVEAICSPGVIRRFHENGYTKVTIQYGRGTKPSVQSIQSPSSSSLPPSLLSIETYDFKPSLLQDMSNADLIISHAGAGTVMECLRKSKRLVVVINTLLMDNHQQELATAMSDRGYLLMVERPEYLHIRGRSINDKNPDDDDNSEDDKNIWSRIERFVPRPYNDGDDMSFPKILNSFMGF